MSVPYVNTSNSTARQNLVRYQQLKLDCEKDLVEIERSIEVWTEKFLDDVGSQLSVLDDDDYHKMVLAALKADDERKVQFKMFWAGE